MKYNRIQGHILKIYKIYYWGKQWIHYVQQLYLILWQYPKGKGKSMSTVSPAPLYFSVLMQTQDAMQTQSFIRSSIYFSDSFETLFCLSYRDFRFYLGRKISRKILAVKTPWSFCKYKLFWRSQTYPRAGIGRNLDDRSLFLLNIRLEMLSQYKM